MLGAAINEKKRDEGHASPDADLALTLSTVFGLNHYPNYLYRFREESEELSKMESLLQQELEKVQKQRKEISVMNKMANNFLTTHPVDSKSSKTTDVRSLRFWLSPTLLKNIGCPTDMSIQDFITSPLSAAMQEIFAEELEIEEGIDGIYSMEFFTKEACGYLMERTKIFAHYLHNHLEKDVEESSLEDFKKRPPPLNYMGLGFLEELLLHIVNIIAPLAFPDYVDCNALDWSHGYIVGYSRDQRAQGMAVQRSGLVTHTDDSEVTCNIALNDDYEGGELVMHGLRGDDDEDEIKTRIKKSSGTLIIHSGRRLHEVASIQEGSRYHLICWTRNLVGIRRRACPCCWMNNRRRQRALDGLIDNCICAEWWN